MRNSLYRYLLVLNITVMLLPGVNTLSAQTTYTAANAHAHNDYNHPVPFWTAYKEGFGSIEADVFLIDTVLYVAHNLADTARARTLESLYLDPLEQAIANSRGYAYADRAKTLLLLIDIKTEAVATLARIETVVGRYKSIVNCKGLKLVITGNQPAIATFTGYPTYIWFDGNLAKEYTIGTLGRIALFSDNFKRYSKWSGEGVPATEERALVQSLIDKAHALKKPIRFWNAPDLPTAWKQFIEWKADYINTDKVAEIAAFFKRSADGR
ncbi:alkaline phosphatase [Segetibacter sp. 3557_3]|uniref:phosphatidylinositol-specific phospholipase C/glycerophosphodiester phosphodiesterase family protein n=1 Tax=Segetibacter sp. 3557_3 TaxID=2547429 RepID=UPI0010588E65|nr:phosphatidylinositol-specific phospholipase C/glycerophosphodiester phosphodiesterase family protein [Segetibacter sp. 3557_3]TDH21666.1 alkaline phosphatase [Segetibacter sp. 3557_3]